MQRLNIMAASKLIASTADELEKELACLKTCFPVKTVRRIPAYVRAALLSGHRVLSEAGLFPIADGMAHDIGLIVASAYGCQTTGFHFMDSLLDAGPNLASPTAFSYSVTNVAAGVVSASLGIQGHNLTISQFELSFGGALQAAAALLEARRARAVVIIAVEENDPRFTACCHEDAPAVGSVAFLVTPDAGDAAGIDIACDVQDVFQREKTSRSALPHALRLYDEVRKGDGHSFVCSQESPFYKRRIRITRQR